MRELKQHIVEGDSANHQLKIEVQDEPGDGGACHRYGIYGFLTDTNASAMDEKDETKCLILFQNGPIPQVGVNGVTHEALLAIIIDRLRGFQSGKFTCRENAIALTHCEEALMWLQNRTRDRIARKVEGTHALHAACTAYYGKLRCSWPDGHTQVRQHYEHYDETEKEYFGILPDGAKWRVSHGAGKSWEEVVKILEDAEYNKEQDAIAR